MKARSGIDILKLQGMHDHMYRTGRIDILVMLKRHTDDWKCQRTAEQPIGIRVLQLIYPQSPEEF